MRSDGRRKLTRVATAVAVLAAALTLGAGASPALAGQHQNAYFYANWNFATNPGADEVEQVVHVSTSAPASFWAQDWTWAGSDDGGYLGLQRDGSRFDGTTGDTAIFSLWNATAASGKMCGTFDGEGNGYSCRLAYPLHTSHQYRYRVVRGAADSSGRWWSASIEDLSTKVVSTLGSIQVATSDDWIGGVQNFTEYFGNAVACNAVPKSVVVWAEPGWRASSGDDFAYGTYYAADGDKGACTDGSETATTLAGQDAVSVSMGGPLHASTTTLVAPAAGVVGKVMRLGAAVHMVDDTAAAGTVQFSVDGTKIGKPVQLAAAASGITYRATRSGSHVITARFIGAHGSQDVSSAASAKVAIRKARSTTKGRLHAKSIARSARATVTVTVAARGVVPKGTVVVLDGAASLAKGSLVKGSVTLTLARLHRTGVHKLRAVYRGSRAVRASTSSVLRLHVRP